MHFLTYTEFIPKIIKEFLLLRLVLMVIVLTAFSYMINKLVDWFFKASHWVEKEVVETIEGVVRSSLKYTTVTIIVIYLIGQFINIKGILAGAGIVGVIVGLAAQQLLKDVLLGLVRLSDREFRVGDYIVFNGSSSGTGSGTIEGIGIRFLQIREWSGKLLTIPHGEIRTIENYNKGKMRVIERITVSYKENPEKVKVLLEEICKSCNEKYGDALLMLEDGTPEQAFRFHGITDLNPHQKYMGYELCVTGLVKPDDYWEISRNVRFDILSVFHDHQIEIPAVHLTFQNDPGTVQALMGEET